MGARHYTKAEVEAEAGQRKPWQTQQRFCTELDTGHMAGIAAQYARAAGEAKNAGDLGERATRASADAGNLNGGTIIDAKERILKDHRGLQSGGADIDRVVNCIVRGMNRAIESKNDVVEDIGWMDWRYNEDLKLYAQECRNLAVDFLAAVERRRTYAPAEANRPLTFTFRTLVHTGENDVEQPVSIDPVVGDSGSVYTLPQSYYDQIRTKYLKLSAKHAGWAYDKIKEHIEVYRRKMLAEARELDDLGYDLGEGPFKLYMTPGMARYVAGKLKAELRKKHPDSQLIEEYTQGLESIARGVYGDGIKPGEPPLRHLTGTERTYLRELFNGLGTDTLARLGTLEDKALNPARTNIANGIQALMNGKIGGFDMSDRANIHHIPASIRAFVYDYKNGALIEPAEPGFAQAMERFNGFGQLMGHATVNSGYAFSQDMARAAVNIETELRGVNTDVRNTGSSGLLKAAAWNPGAAADLLREPGFRSRLLYPTWDDSSGAAALVKNGTTLPPGVHPNGAEGAKFWEAAHGVLSFIGEHPQYANPTVSMGYADVSDLQREVGNLAIRNMTLIAADTKLTGGVDTWSRWEPTTANWGFGLTGDQRTGLFTYMNEADQNVRTKFFGDVGEWQYRTASEAFKRSEEDGYGFGTAIRGIGVIQGTVAEVQDRRAEWGTAAGTINAIGTAATMLPGPPAVIGAGVAAGGAGAAVAISNLDPAKNWDLEARIAIARAAIEANFKPLENEPGIGDQINKQYYIQDADSMVDDVFIKPGMPGIENVYKRGFDDRYGE